MKSASGSLPTYEINGKGKRSFSIKFRSSLFKGGDRKDKCGGVSRFDTQWQNHLPRRGVGDKVPKVLSSSQSLRAGPRK